MKQSDVSLWRTRVIIIDDIHALSCNELLVTKVLADNTLYTVSGKSYYDKGSLFHDHKPIIADAASNLCAMGQVLEKMYGHIPIAISKWGRFEIAGNLTDAALWVLSKKIAAPGNPLLQESQKIYESVDEKGVRASVYAHHNHGVAYTVGSPQALALNVRPVAESFLQEGLHVVAVSARSFDTAQIPRADDERDQFFKTLCVQEGLLLGLCGIYNALRPEAPATIAKARAMGLRVILMGDAPLPLTITQAKQLGIYQDYDEAVDGAELLRMPHEQLQEILPGVTVFSEMNQTQKTRILTMLDAHQMVTCAQDFMNIMGAIEKKRRARIQRRVRLRGAVTAVTMSVAIAFVILRYQMLVDYFYGFDTVKMASKYLIFLLRKLL